MILTDSEEIAQRLRSLRAHGSLQKYLSLEQGWNSRLDELQAAILRAKLPYLEYWNENRRSRAAAYTKALSPYSNITCPINPTWGQHVFHQYTVRISNREQIKQGLAQHNIASSVYYPVPIHLQPIYQHLGYKRGDLPVTEQAAAEVLSLPMYPELRDAQIELIADVLGRPLR